MTAPIVLVATWSDGLFVVSGKTRDQELVTRSVRGLVPDGESGALAIVAGRSPRRRAPDGVWTTIASTEFDLSCCVAVGDVIYVGTDDARVLRLGAGGALEQLHGFDEVAGRETWYAGSAVINGELVGPPLGAARSPQPRTDRSSSPTSASAVYLDRPTAAQPGSPQSTSIATSTRFGRTRTVQTS